MSGQEGNPNLSTTVGRDRMKATDILRNRLVLALVLALFVTTPAMAAAPTDIRAAISDRLARTQGPASIGDMALDVALLGRIYGPADFAPLWVGGAKAAAKAAAIVDRLKRADEDGLDPNDYGVSAILARTAATDATVLSELDLLLTQALVRFGGDIQVGRIPPEVVDPGLKAFARKRGALKIVADARGAADLDTHLATLGPRDPRYQRLKRTLSWYREIAAKGGWPTLPEGKTLKPGMSDKRVRVLRERLAITGDIFGIPKEPDLFDANVERAVRVFQRRHGLEADGAVGRKTRGALNLPVEQKITAIILNLERRRWLAADMGKRFVFVNIADAVVKLVDGDKTILDMRAVVGAPFHRTPVFSDEITYLQLNPYWNVPASIGRRELLPKAKKDANYLSDRGIKVRPRTGGGAWTDARTVDWSTVPSTRLPYRFRQDPGPRNALGRVKIMFPNKYAIYLHDTPARALFKKSTRTFSHGCIRLHRPLELAAMLLSDRPKWNRDAIDAVLESKKVKTVRMSKPIPVHISYLTAWVNKDMSAHFRPDVYGRDKNLAAALRRHAPR